MPGIEISALPAATSAQVTDVFPADQLPGPVTRKITIQQVLDLLSGTFVESVSGTTNRITSTGGVNPIIDIAANYVGQTSITTLGTITSGTWNGTIISPVYGGTGINNGANTLTLAGSLTTVGAFPATFNFTASTNVTFPTSGTLATTAMIPTVIPSPLTATPDTNVTITLGGTPATALLQATSITLGWTGTLSPVRGGTGVNNGTNTLTLAGNLSTVGAFTAVFNFTAATNVTFPTSGTLATTATASGIVSSGLINQLAWYAANGTTVSGLTTANNGVLVTSGTGVPSISSTLPSGMAATNMNLTTPTLGAATATSLTFSPTTNGIVGTTTNNNAATGYVGEYVTATSASTGITTNTSTNIQTISLTAGDWDVWGVISFAAAAGTLPTTLSAGVSTTSATLGVIFQQLQGITWGSGASNTLAAPMVRVSIASTTTVYLVGFATFTVSTMNTVGTIIARRVR